MKMTFEELESEFEKRIRKLNPDSFLDMAELNQKSAEILGEIVSENIFNFYNVEAVCKGILRRYCDKMNKTNSTLQKKYDEKNGLQIAPQKADFPTERVQKIINSLTDKTVPPETIQRRARNAIENVAKSFHDDYVRKNAEFRSKAGIKCYIVRETNGKCCKWCSSLAGRYLYVDAPDDIFRRHDNCTCMVTFENGRERQDVWSKKKWQVSTALEVPYQPFCAEKNQAENLQKNQLAKYIGLDKSKNNLTSVKNNSIMNDIELNLEIKSKYYSGKATLFDITDERIEKIPLIKTKILTDEQDIELQKYSKELLSYMKNDKSEREGLIAFNMNMKKIRQYKGDENKLSVSLPDDVTEQCVVIHNHPSGLIFSPKDLEQFSFHDEVRLLGAIGNNGNVYFIEKMKNFDSQQFDFDYYQLQNKHGKINEKNEFIPNSNEALFEFIEELLERGEECGFNTYIKTNT